MMTTFTLLLATVSLLCCTPTYKIPDTPLPEPPQDGTVVWLDLMNLNSTNTNDTTQTKKMWDALHITTTLQGIVNRDKPVLYINYINACGTNTDEYWWDIYSAPGEWLSGMKRTILTDPVEACDIFRDHVNGLVVYDPKIPATSCVASMIAGVEDLIAVRYDPAPGSYYNRLTSSRDYPVKVWLVEPDGKSKFSSKTDTYRWAIDNYLIPGKCSTDFLGYYLDQCWLKNPGAATKNHHQLTNHDFFVSHRSFFFDLSPWEDEVATDDPQGIVGEDYRTMNEILMQVYLHNGNGNTFCHIGGFPAWAYKYSNHSKVGGKHTPVETEWKFAEIIGEYNAYKDADAIAYGAMANASFWQHFPLKESYPQKWITREELKAKGYITSEGKVNMNKRYIIMYVGDYDAAPWIYQTTVQIYDDTARGTVPMMWSVSPVLSLRAPQAMHYMWTHATENDYFAAADNGAGYLNPGSLQAPRAISGLPDGMEQWAAHCKPWYEKWGLTVSGFIIDGNAKGMDTAGFNAYATFSPNGIVPQKTPQKAKLYNGMPVMRSEGGAGYDDPRDAVDHITLATTDHVAFPFYWFRCVLKTPTWYAAVRDGLAQKKAEVVWCTGPEYFELLRCYLETNK